MLSSASELLLAIPRQTKFHWNKWSKDILAEPQSLSLDDFVIQKSLCKTGTCEILLCTDKNGEEVVLKKINNKKMDQNLLQNELDAGKSLQNGRIVKFYGHFQDSAKDNTYLVLEYLKGCDLFTYMSEKDFKPLPEDHAKQIFIQVVKALLYVHKNNFAHRDIKMENIFLTEKGKVKLIDFGFATRTKPGEFYSQWCGSEDYVCPEILMQQPYCAENVDIWSLGVVLYLMLFARIPFYFKSRVKAILSHKGHPPLKFPDEDHPHGDEQTTFGTVSHHAKDLIAQMLEVDPNKRISLHQVLKHPWLKNEAPSSFQKFLVMFNLQ